MKLKLARSPPALAYSYTSNVLNLKNHFCNYSLILVVFFLFDFVIKVNASQTMALEGIKLETLVSEPDALTTRPPQVFQNYVIYHPS